MSAFSEEHRLVALADASPESELRIARARRGMSQAVDLFSGMGCVAEGLADVRPVVTNDALAFTAGFARARFTTSVRALRPSTTCWQAFTLRPSAMIILIGQAAHLGVQGSKEIPQGPLVRCRCHNGCITPGGHAPGVSSRWERDPSRSKRVEVSPPTVSPIGTSGLPQRVRSRGLTSHAAP